MRARIIASFAGVAISLAACGSGSPTTAGTAVTASASVAPTQPAPSPPSEPASAWSYSTDKDEMRGTTTSFATLGSENEVSVGTPYDPDHARLTLRQRPEDGLNIILRGPGQFLCHNFNEGHVSVKFDNGPIERFSCVEPSDATSGQIFISSEKKFLNRLQASKKMIIEAEFFQAGMQQMIFQTAGLVWPPKT